MRLEGSAEAVENAAAWIPADRRNCSCPSPRSVLVCGWACRAPPVRGED